MEKCPICELPASLGAYNGGCFKFDCLRCGEFSITTEADAFLRAVPLDPLQVAAASGYIRSNQGLTIYERDISTLREARIPTVDAKAARLLLAFAQEYPQPGATIPDPVPRIAFTLSKLAECGDQATYPDSVVPEYASFLKWLAIVSTNDLGELDWLIREVLIAHSFLECTKKMESFESRGLLRLLLTARGWAEIERMRSANPQSVIGFVAMSFHDDFSELYSMGIAPGITEAGFEPLRMDRKEHNNRIDDEIVASIRSSRFLVADFSVDRGGIYFEAGYALGLGLPVIWLVRESEIDTIHFDNRQYNFIRWKPDDYVGLQGALKNRIEATIGRGPLPRKEKK